LWVVWRLFDWAQTTRAALPTPSFSSVIQKESGALSQNLHVGRHSKPLDNRIANVIWRMMPSLFLFPTSLSLKPSACRNQVGKAIGSGPSYSIHDWPHVSLSFPKPTTKFVSFPSSLTCALVLILAHQADMLDMPRTRKTAVLATSGPLAPSIADPSHARSSFTAVPTIGSIHTVLPRQCDAQSTLCSFRSQTMA
jgi:hypothetical protein